MCPIPKYKKTVFSNGFLIVTKEILYAFRYAVKGLQRVVKTSNSMSLSLWCREFQDASKWKRTMKCLKINTILWKILGKRCAICSSLKESTRRRSEWQLHKWMKSQGKSLNRRYVIERWLIFLHSYALPEIVFFLSEVSRLKAYTIPKGRTNYRK